MTYLRFALPIWLLAQMRITCLVHRWIADALDGAEIPNESEIIHALAIRNHKLISPTLTPTREVFSRISEYIRCRVELNVALYCLEQLQPTALNGRVITTRKMGSGSIKLVDLLDLARRTSGALKADLAYGGSPTRGYFYLARQSGSERGAIHATKGKARISTSFCGFCIAPSTETRRVVIYWCEKVVATAQASVCFPDSCCFKPSHSLPQRPNKPLTEMCRAVGSSFFGISKNTSHNMASTSRLQQTPGPLNRGVTGLGLLNGSPDAGSSVAVACPF